ncbi:MAG: hypothetical protein KZQ64_09880 [gamma proteobacterium symbiont of Bathyaustriella thionipta]|nr:hypothetical protein [gamma proteobacterium symbiont of Bathyaustriella thionipta]MCU7949256.1 hypothetical protein [gamma proteobacterium symbiont of Bathyaustriella thionipta]MCU7953680.1 hypothetical protein [gamma proteobacterium symbiont of Bathyaustriella thionipta]MCU7955844.1 hypothetical protein [gamma proteobacterium symbiont of Bathyaustriella thionipta]MCU7966928.1 hypothetical protein [gamma proteobacterium symbiont of Bathyaustriella thionipta]
MCIKAGNNELDSVKALMTMSLNALIADVFDVEPDEISRNLSLSKDLGMDTEKEQKLRELIGEYFDGLMINLSSNDSLDMLFQSVIDTEFKTVQQDEISH